jgi:hypothetical protein
LILNGDEQLLAGVLTGEVSSEQLTEGICSKQWMGLEEALEHSDPTTLA